LVLIDQPRYWQVRQYYDAIFGNRKKRGDGKSRAYIEKILCLILKYYFRVSVPDSNAPFRLMSSLFLKEFLPKIPKNFNLPNVMLTTFGVYYRRRVKFIDISFINRQCGVNSINISKIVKIGFKAIKDFKHFKKNM